MRIGIDARFYGPRVGGGGLGRYVAELVTNLQTLDRNNSYVLFLRKENFHECVIKNQNFSKRLVDVPWYTVEEQRVMPREIAHAKVHFMHYPHWNVPIFSRVPFLVTIHDLILLQDGKSARASTRNPFIHGLKQVGHRIALEHAVHRSRHIIAVSEFTKASILTHFRVKSQKISVIPNGVGRPGEGKNVDLPALGVNEPYFLYVGNAYPHKNLDMLIQAFALFLKTNKSVQLVIAGRRDMFSKAIEKMAGEIGITPQALRFVDLPTDEELAALYRRAQLFIYPSRIEGFGIPPLEAMSYGTPVAASKAASIPEILGSHAQYFDQDDIEALADIMHKSVKGVWHNSALLEEAKRHVRKFNWEDTAKKTLQVYANVATRRV